MPAVPLFCIHRRLLIPLKQEPASRRHPDEAMCVRLLSSDQIFCVCKNKLAAELLRSALKPESWFLIAERTKRGKCMQEGYVGLGLQMLSWRAFATKGL
jgi:hypothetical protein